MPWPGSWKTWVYAGFGLALILLLAWAHYQGRRQAEIELLPKIEAARSAASTAALETQGAEASTARIETALRTETRVREKTHALEISARAEPTSELPAAVADRLRNHDRFLCEQTPGFGCGAASEDAGDGE